jgi:hypothetical protein
MNVPQTDDADGTGDILMDTTIGNEQAIIKFLRPLIPDVRNQNNIVLAHPFEKVTVQTALFEAYTELLHEINGTSGTAVSLVGQVKDPLEFFQSRFLDTPATQSGKKPLANLVVRALTSPVSSVAAERGGSILHNLGSYDRRKMGKQAMQDNMFLRVNKSYVQRLRAIAVNRVRMRAPKVRTTAHVNNHDSGSRIHKLNPSRETQKRERQEEKDDLVTTMKKKKTKSKGFGTGMKQTTLFRYLPDDDNDGEDNNNDDDDDDEGNNGAEEEEGKEDDDNYLVDLMSDKEVEEEEEEEPSAITSRGSSKNLPGPMGRTNRSASQRNYSES